MPTLLLPPHSSAQQLALTHSKQHRMQQRPASRRHPEPVAVLLLLVRSLCGFVLYMLVSGAPDTIRAPRTSHLHRDLPARPWARSGDRLTDPKFGRADRMNQGARSAGKTGTESRPSAADSEPRSRVNRQLVQLPRTRHTQTDQRGRHPGNRGELTWWRLDCNDLNRACPENISSTSKHLPLSEEPPWQHQTQ